jgi:hypothetical protein
MQRKDHLYTGALERGIRLRSVTQIGQPCHEHPRLLLELDSCW